MAKFTKGVAQRVPLEKVEQFLADFVKFVLEGTTHKVHLLGSGKTVTEYNLSSKIEDITDLDLAISYEHSPTEIEETLRLFEGKCPRCEWKRMRNNFHVLFPVDSTNYIQIDLLPYREGDEVSRNYNDWAFSFSLDDFDFIGDLGFRGEVRNNLLKTLARNIEMYNGVRKLKTKDVQEENYPAYAFDITGNGLRRSATFENGIIKEIPTSESEYIKDLSKITLEIFDIKDGRIPMSIKDTLRDMVKSAERRHWNYDKIFAELQERLEEEVDEEKRKLIPEIINRMKKYMDFLIN